MQKDPDQKQPTEATPGTLVDRRTFLVRSVLGAGALALTSVAAGCGNGGSSSSSTSSLLSSTAWKFGVMGDTQWTTPHPVDDGYNANSSAVSIATQIQKQFISSGVKFVVHVGDFCDATNSTAGQDTRALFAQSLYNAGIGFFPVRGNHDDGQAIAEEFIRLYPQTGAVSSQAGIHNASPTDITGLTFSGASAVTSDHLTVPTESGSSFTCGENFSSPDPYGDGGLKGLSYSFDYSGVRFVLLDQFTPATAPSNYLLASSSTQAGSIALQESWLSSQLSGRTSGSHAFVFAHKGLVTCQHADCLFGTDPSQDSTYGDAFVTSLYNNKVHYFIHGHDHIHDRSLVSTSDSWSASGGPKAWVTQMLCASDSSKFYVPAGSGNYTTSATGSSSNDVYYDVTVAAKGARRKVVAQELYTVGYYLFTVDGNNITVDYYAADVYPYQYSASELIVTTANGLNFTHRERYGYGLTGQQFILASGSAYTTVTDTSSNGTVVKLLDGTANSNGGADANNLAFIRDVNTGWTTKAGGAVSDIVSLWGVTPTINASSPDTFTISLSNGATLSSTARLAALDDDGSWVNAVTLNNGGSAAFVNGPWKSGYALGTYGYDSTSNTVWAVLNQDGRFAIVNNL